MPVSGDLVLLDQRASVQFAGARSIWLRVSSVSDRPTYFGWVWLTGYAVDPVTGNATARREVFVRIAGMQILPRNAAARSPAAVRRRNAGPGADRGRRV
ncbi:hypothetical protein ABT336_14625 [Micromonospora sp. NPDC000207]|uniref:hypothetical protein n=1 Tax=Micromonospora sp. NPDC000207 TaxID=3154246 RepID=UPI0033323987